MIATLMILLPSISYASTNNETKNISLNDILWNLHISTRSLYSPFTAYYDEYTLTIYNEEPAYDLVITITNVQSGNVVYTQEVPQESSDLITIPLTGLGKGEYCLVISHPEAGYIYGTFNL